MARGSVKNVRPDKGYGFLWAGAGRQIFFHVTDLSPDLPFDDTLLERDVEYEPVQTADGRWRATKVRPIGGGE
jgi:cold shock CspA family protein